MTGHLRKATFATALAMASFTAQPALADAGGVSFWLPGTFGSLAATPAVPGWAYETIYIHLQMSAGAGKNFVTTNGIPGSVVAGLNAHADALVEGSPTPRRCRYSAARRASACSPLREMSARESAPR